MRHQDQAWKDGWEGKVSIPCPKCGKVAARVSKDMAERTDELVGVVCTDCGHRFDYPTDRAT